MKSNTETLALAKKYLGKGGATFRSYCGLPSGSAWCNAFVTYIFHKSGNSSLYCNGKIQTYCPTSIKWCYNNLANIPVYLALAGDIIYFDWELNGVPNHIGFVKERKSDTQIYTLEGNTSGGIVAYKTRSAKYVQAVFRPAYKATYTLGTITVDGYFGYNSIANMQKALGLTPTGILDKATVKALQKKAGVTQDGSWGTGTSKAVQKMVGVTQDGYFGANSVKALQKWINTQNAKLSKKLGAKANELAYASAPTEAKYPSGSPTTAYKKALNKAYPDRSSWGKPQRLGASCDVFVGTCIRAVGIDSTFPRKLVDQQTRLANSDKFKCAISATSKNINASLLADGDVITYLKKDGSRHICIYYNGKLKHAASKAWYGRTTGTGSYIKISGKKWIKVYRVR